MRTDRASRTITADPASIYAALTDAEAVRIWLPPAGARGVIEAFEPRPGGPFRVTLIFGCADGTVRKLSETSDVVTGEFVELVPDALIRQRFTFESEDPAFAGTMDMTWVIRPTEQGAEVSVSAQNVPVGITPQEHQAGMASSLENLDKFLS